MLAKLAQIIEKAIEKVQQEEKNQRQDLYILAMSYGGHLKAKAPNMVKDSDFHQVLYNRGNNNFFVKCNLHQLRLYRYCFVLTSRHFF